MAATRAFAGEGPKPRSSGNENINGRRIHEMLFVVQGRCEGSTK